MDDKEVMDGTIILVSIKTHFGSNKVRLLIREIVIHFFGWRGVIKTSNFSRTFQTLIGQLIEFFPTDSFELIINLGHLSKSWDITWNIRHQVLQLSFSFHFI